MIWKELTNIDTIQFSDSTEISPDGKYCINCCYQLEESSKSRKGSVLLINLENECANVVSKDLEIDGILDCCWMNSNEVILASALGNLYFYQTEFNNLSLRTTIKIDDCLCLSVDCHLNKIICTTSIGDVVLHDFNNNILFSDKIHDFEAWVGHLSRHEENLFFSGGDDCRFNGLDLRCGGKKIFSKRFDMGCTSIQSHPIDSNLVSTGSYDETVKIWDLRCMRGVVKSIEVGGGVWRHKWSPDGAPLVLVAGMYGGFSVIRTDGDNSATSFANSSHSKDGLAYGADWIKMDHRYLISACSFYDHRWTLSTLSL